MDWAGYWSKDDFWRDSQLWEISSKLFYQSAKRFVEFKKTDTVLDIGCGAGYTEALLAPLVRSVYAVDVAKQFVEICSQRCQGHGNLRAGYLNKDDYTNLEGCPGPFSIILCVSVVQYYRNLDEVESLINSVKKLASSGARMLIADLPLQRGKLGFLWDVLCSCFLSMRKGYFITLLSMAYTRWCHNTHYKSFCAQAQQLYFSEDKLKTLIKKLKINARIIKGDFSVYANRISLLIQF
jgi:2-polyprenyl-3-methyl-5-hydroxy-6-metoxy-1,4-benzoquinol methylase